MAQTRKARAVRILMRKVPALKTPPRKTKIPKACAPIS